MRNLVVALVMVLGMFSFVKTSEASQTVVNVNVVSTGAHGCATCGYVAPVPPPVYATPYYGGYGYGYGAGYGYGYGYGYPYYPYPYYGGGYGGCRSSGGFVAVFGVAVGWGGSKCGYGRWGRPGWGYPTPYPYPRYY